MRGCNCGFSKMPRAHGLSLCYKKTTSKSTLVPFQERLNAKKNVYLCTDPRRGSGTGGLIGDIDSPQLPCDPCDPIPSPWRRLPPTPSSPPPTAGSEQEIAMAPVPGIGTGLDVAAADFGLGRRARMVTGCKTGFAAGLGLVADDRRRRTGGVLGGVPGGVTPLPLARLSPMARTKSRTETPRSSGGSVRTGGGGESVLVQWRGWG